MKHCFLLFFLLLLLFFGACKQGKKPDVQTLVPFSDDRAINAVIEIPAGTNQLIEYQEDTEKFRIREVGGEEQKVNYLPYPGNYGFIPGTYLDPAKGGNGQSLDVLVLAESCETGTLMQVLPVAALVLRNEGKPETKIIAIPADSSLQVLPLRDFAGLITEYQSVQRIVEIWFLNHKGLGKMEMLSWQNERYAEEEIKKWTKPN